MTRMFVTIFAVFFMTLHLWSTAAAYHLSDESNESLSTNEPYITSESTALQITESPELDSSSDSDSSNKPVVIPSPVPYQIHAGDTFYQIAHSFGISVSAIIAANPDKNPNGLKIGEQLVIPIQEPALQLANGEATVIKQVLSSTLTAYTAGYESTGKSPNNPQYGITYSGSQAEEGRTIAVDPNVIPIGTKVYIDGVGIRTAEDTGSAIRGPRIDVFMTNEKAARQFGVKKNVKVYVLEESAA